MTSLKYEDVVLEILETVKGLTFPPEFNDYDWPFYVVEDHLLPHLVSDDATPGDIEAGFDLIRRMVESDDRHMRQLLEDGVVKWLEYRSPASAPAAARWIAQMPGALDAELHRQFPGWWPRLLARLGLRYLDNDEYMREARQWREDALPVLKWDDVVPECLAAVKGLVLPPDYEFYDLDYVVVESELMPHLISGEASSEDVRAGLALMLRMAQSEDSKVRALLDVGIMEGFEYGGPAIEPGSARLLAQRPPALDDALHRQFPERWPQVLAKLGLDSSRD